MKYNHNHMLRLLNNHKSAKRKYEYYFGTTKLQNKSLIWAIVTDYEDLANDIIDEFGDKCKPDILAAIDGVHGRGTALAWACFKKHNKVAMKLMEKFGIYCNISIKKKWQHHAFTSAVNGCNENVVMKMLNIFERGCKPLTKLTDTYNYQYSIIDNVLNNNMCNVMIKLVKIYGINIINCNKQNLEKFAKHLNNTYCALTTILKRANIIIPNEIQNTNTSPNFVHKIMKKIKWLKNRIEFERYRHIDLHFYKDVSLEICNYLDIHPNIPDFY